MAVNKGQKDMADHIDKALDELEANDTYNRLIRKWFAGIPGFSLKGVLK
ncbi:transporter substrate-binding domain-containing protein [Bacillus thuringiensis]